MPNPTQASIPAMPLHACRATSSASRICFVKSVHTPLFATLLLGTFAQHVLADELTVSAAASLTNAFKDIAQAYEKQYPDARVHLNFGASGALLAQMAKGAPVDVFASADQPTMDKAEKQGLLKPHAREDFARNTLVLIVPAHSTLSLKTLDDLGKADVQKVALGNPATTPAGNYARETMQAGGQWDTVSPKIIHTQNVRQSLDYVARGEVDAGFVYGTDARVAKDKVKVAFDVATQSPILYPIAYTAQTANTAEARRFINYLHSDAGQAVLARYGFAKP